MLGDGLAGRPPKELLVLRRARPVGCFGKRVECVDERRCRPSTYNDQIMHHGPLAVKGNSCPDRRRKPQRRTGQPDPYARPPRRPRGAKRIRPSCPPPSCALRAGPDSSPSHPETAAPRRPLQDVPGAWTRPGGGRASTAPRPTDGGPPAAQNRAGRLLNRWDRQGKTQDGRAARRNADSRRRGGDAQDQDEASQQGQRPEPPDGVQWHRGGTAGPGLIAKARYRRRVGRCDTPPAIGFALPFPCHGRCAKGAFASPMSIAILDLIRGAVRHPYRPITARNR